MLFNSLSFLLIFAPIVYALYWTRRTLDGKKVVLVVASYVFYGVWSWKFAALMLGTTSVDYYTAQRIEGSGNERGRRAWLTISMIANLGVLVVFKYLNFVIDTVNSVAGKPLLPLLSIILPIGISFYTFESMSYTIDVFRRRKRALVRFLDYAHFVTMFPRLVAGPIVRYNELADQLRTFATLLDDEVVLEGAKFLTMGMAKKLLVADLIAKHIVDPAFSRASELGACEAWGAALGYTAQLYFDFSGYSDMAVGLALWLGFRLPRNFNLPYRARNISDFWRRWHISLSSWLRDYLFISLGGSRGSAGQTLRNLGLTMVLGGLWHGANWTFVLWGAYHGLALIVHRVATSRRPTTRWPETAGVALTFVVVVIGWVLFRAATVTEAATMLRAMVGAHGLGAAWATANARWLGVLGAALVVSFWRDTYDVPTPRNSVGAVALALLFLVCLTRLSQPSPFLYFQF
jgi:alginate O-acetyltransferase complex protein AlgI